MIAFLDNVVTYITSVSTAGAYATLSRQTFSAQPDAQTAVITSGTQDSDKPVRVQPLQLLVRDTDIRTAAARAEGLHALFAPKGRASWVNTCGLGGWFLPDHGVGPMFFDGGNLPVFTLNYRFHTVSASL